MNGNAATKCTFEMRCPTKMKLLRILINYFVCGIFVASLFGPDHAQAWHAVPHMVVGALARLSMTELAQSKIEYILGFWRGQYPNHSTIERACTWLSDISLKEGVGTNLARRFDFIELFKHMHAVPKPWNPHNIKLKGLDAHLPIYEKSALFLLDTAYKGLLMTTTSIEKLEDPFCTIPPVVRLVPLEQTGVVQAAAGATGGEYEAASTTLVRTSGSHGPPSSSSSSRRRPPPYRPPGWREPVEIPAGIGSILSLNLYLRIILHLLLDIHQPLHTMAAFYAAFPTGDMSGNNVLMKMPDGTKTTLHRFWDSAALLYTKNASDVTDSEILEEARKLEKEFPITRMLPKLTKGLLAPNFSNIVDESYALGTSFVYRDLNLGKLKYSDLPYKPSAAYIEEARAVTRQQLALAGYRLAHCLEVIAKYLPYPGTVMNTDATG